MGGGQSCAASRVGDRAWHQRHRERDASSCQVIPHRPSASRRTTPRPTEISAPRSRRRPRRTPFPQPLRPSSRFWKPYNQS